MTAAMFDHPVLSGWAGDVLTSNALSFNSDLAAMLRFEGVLAEVQAAHGLIPADCAARIVEVCATFQPDLHKLREATLRDGVVVPGLIADLRMAVGEKAAGYLHYGATSQDVIDTSLMLRLKPLLADFGDRLAAISAMMLTLEQRGGATPIMAYTRMRAALPSTATARVQNWRVGLDLAAQQVEAVQANTLAVQYGGPIGTLDKLGAKAGCVRASLADMLDLSDPGRSWHVERSRILTIAAGLTQTTQALGKIGLDIGLMAQDGVEQITLDGGRSSSMPHKVNPVDAELLVALARHNATLLGGIGQAGLHEYERSGGAWTQEWLTLPQMLGATGAALNATVRLLGKIHQLGASFT